MGSLKAMERTVDYRGFAIELVPVDNLGVKAFIRPYSPAYIKQPICLMSVSFRNEFPMGRGVPAGQRASAESAALCLKWCQKWIDKRVDVEGAINAVADEHGRVAE